MTSYTETMPNASDGRDRPVERAGARRAEGARDGGRARFRLESKREFRHFLSVCCAVVASWAARVLPHRPRQWLADRGGDLFYRTSHTYRENVRSNLAEVFDPGIPEATRAETEREVFRTSGRNFADLLMVPHQSRHDLRASVQVLNGSFDWLDEAVAAGRGVVLITGHLGSFDVVGQVLHAKGYKLTAVTGRTTARFLFDAVTHLRRSHGMRLVEASPSGVRRAIQALRRGECAVFVTDRDFFLNGKPVRFFGRETTLPPGAVRIARDTGATVLPIYSVRLPDAHGLWLDPGFVVPKTSDLEADLRLGLERIVQSLERAIAANPGQWVMFQRVWPSAPVDPVRVFPVGSPLETDILERVGAALPGRRPTD